MTEYLLGLDSGGTMTKAALFTMDGHEVASESQPIQMLFPGPGFTERDAPDMWTATCGAIKSVLSKANVSGDAIRAIGATGYGAGIFCVDADGKPTRNAVVSTDSRAAGIVSDWQAEGLVSGTEQIVCQSVWQAQTLTLMKWLQINEPETVARTSRIFECKDYSKMCLTGVINTDYSDAALCGLVDMKTNEYAIDMLQTLGLEEWIEKLPPRTPSTDCVGNVTEVAAAQTGLKVGTPVVAGAIDIVCAALASGVTRTEQVSVVAGTWSINSMLREQPQTDPMPVLQMPYVLNDMFVSCEASATSASNLEWMCKKVLGAEAILAEKDGRSIYDVCSELVESRRQKPSDVFFFPYLYGGPNNARSSFIGMSASDDKADLVHAVYEGIVFAHKTHVDALLSAPSTPKPAVIRLAGGAAKSAVWAQMFADVMNLPVEITDSSELGAMGASMLGAVGIKAYADVGAAVANMVRIGRTYQPDASMHDMYMSRFSQFQKFNSALDQHW